MVRKLNPVKEEETIQLINPEKKPLTIEKLRELSGLTLSDEEAEKMVDSIRMLAKILYDFANQEKDTCIDNQHVVNLNERNLNNQKLAA